LRCGMLHTQFVFHIRTSRIASHSLSVLHVLYVTWHIRVHLACCTLWSYYTHTNELHRLRLSLSLLRHVSNMTHSSATCWYAIRACTSPTHTNKSYSLRLSLSLLRHVCDMAHSYVTWPIRMWHGPFVCDMTHYMWHAEKITWLMRCDIQRSHSLERI